MCHLLVLIKSNALSVMFLYWRRMQPSPLLSLLVEVQVAEGADLTGQEGAQQELVSCGWTRLQLFDQHNQVRSGHWRLPFRVLPVRPTLSPEQLNSVPQASTAALYTVYRMSVESWTDL